ncbi:MAG: SpoIID/LytB domain-containing protein [Acidobacteriota bacterium]
MRVIKADIVLLLLCAAVAACGHTPVSSPGPSPERNSDPDAELARVAREALGEREGTILVIDPRDGRIRVVVNPRLAFEQTFPPGSAIKPFTSLAALRTGVAERKTRHLCSGRYRTEAYEIVCSHPQSKSSFDLPQALAYSCNDYFGVLSERLSEGSFAAALSAFGFGRRTGINAVSEAPGHLPEGDWSARIALGEGDDLLVTPIQLLSAYSALVNGGNLYRPRMAPRAGFGSDLRAALKVSPAHRSIIVDGMRGAVTFGTARDAKLDSIGDFVFGKTGTSTTSSGFRTQGWFVGFAGESDARIGVLVFLKRAHGSEGAAIARPIFESASRERDVREAPADVVRVHLVSEDKTLQLSMEDYISGVVGVEGSTEDEREALKALAVVSRTFAARNRGRHAAEGYDFCSTTHCQRYVVGPAPEAARNAVRETAGELLKDQRGQPIDAYFSAACGGVTADIAKLWGVVPLSYLRVSRDDYCSMGANQWLDRIPSKALVAALSKDARTNVGRRLKDIVVTRTDESGRAEWIALEGEQRRIVRGWDFKIIVGRTLGWNLLKSSRFQVRKEGDQFVFRGSGFGHGLGLCQAGAHVAARRGLSYSRILNYYFPGLSSVREETSLDLQGKAVPSYASLQRSSGRTSRSEHFLLRGPPSLAAADRETIFRALESARADVLGRLNRAEVRLSETHPLEVVVHETTADFIRHTGQPGWVAAATDGARIALQPVVVLRRRANLATTLRHEYVHAVIESLGRGKTPRWLAEGIAIHVAGEGNRFSAGGRRPTIMMMSTDELERRLARPTSADDMRALYFVAYDKVRALVRDEGESALWRRVAVHSTALRPELSNSATR